MKVLALETSTTTGSVALIIDGQVAAEKFSLRQRSHSEIINPFVDECLRQCQLKLEDIDAFAVGQGPGSFTGIRVAANAGKSFSYCYNKPLIAVDSLTLLARQAQHYALPTLTMINAYKNMVYFGLFDVSGVEPRFLQGPLAVPVRDLKKLINQKCVAVGDGWADYFDYFPEELKALLVRQPDLSDAPLASTLGQLAHQRLIQGQTMDWKSFVPLYIRASEAEESKKGIIISPLK
jgi:tRNA threonylcarbamoyladenosine biosynthesis protein TsaB